MGRPDAVVAVGVLLDERQVFVCADHRPRVAGQRDDGQRAEDGVDGAPLEAELAEVASRQQCALSRQKLCRRSPRGAGRGRRRAASASPGAGSDFRSPCDQPAPRETAAAPPRAEASRNVADPSQQDLQATGRRIRLVTSGTLIREARLRAGLSQIELSQRSGKDRAQLARWERDVVQPSFETLRELVRACGFDLETNLVPYEPDPAHDARLEKTLQPLAAGAAPGDAQGPRPLMAGPFDPIAILQALDEQRVSYVVVGALGRVIHGSDELTDGIDIVPSHEGREPAPARWSRSTDLDARRSDGRPLALDRDLAGAGARAVDDAGELKVVPEPAGTAGYDDLRRGASANRSDAASARRSPRPATSPACSPPSIASRTACRSRRCGA